MWRAIIDVPPPQDVEVMTKVDDEDGCRNEQSLRLWNNLWFFPDKSMYVYYTPTHWKPLRRGGR